MFTHFACFYGSLSMRCLMIAFIDQVGGNQNTCTYNLRGRKITFLLYYNKKNIRQSCLINLNISGTHQNETNFEFFLPLYYSLDGKSFSDVPLIEH